MEVEWWWKQGTSIWWWKQFGGTVDQVSKQHLIVVMSWVIFISMREHGLTKRRTSLTARDFSARQRCRRCVVLSRLARFGGSHPFAWRHAVRCCLHRLRKGDDITVSLCSLSGEQNAWTIPEKELFRFGVMSSLTSMASLTFYSKLYTTHDTSDTRPSCIMHQINTPKCSAWTWTHTNIKRNKK